MLVADLIRQAFFTAHVIRENEEAIGFKAVQGLQFLNEIIDDWGDKGIYIPYHTTTLINLVANTPSYNIPLIAELDEAKLLVSTNVQFPLQISDTYLFNSFNFSFPIARPSAVYLSTEQIIDDTGTEVSQVWFWPTPNQSYTARLIQKQTLSNVLLFDNLKGLPRGVNKTFRYQLASDIQDVYGTELPDRFYEKLKSLVSEMEARNPSDNTVQTRDEFHTQRRFKPWGYGPVQGGGF